MIDKARLEAKCAALQIPLTPAQLDGLDAYAELLVEYNKKVNLTAITDPEGIEDKHFADSLLFAVRPELKGTVADVGSGAGFPGLVTALYRPELSLTLIEPTGKRCDFLRYAAEQLGLANVTVVKERAEEAARKQWRESFDIACARAVAALPVLAEYCLPLVKQGGTMIALKGSTAAEELTAAEGACRKLGGGKALLLPCTLPAGDARALIFVPKKGITPPVYPRNGGKIAKAPLK